MEEIHLIDIVMFLSFFLILVAFIQKYTKNLPFLPYTVALLIAGAGAQFLTHYLHIDIHLGLSPDMIYYILLPLLLFESAFHINLHQFRIQFKTITFLATFGLLVSIFAIAYSLMLLAGYPLKHAILFGALISATDPIAVITLFKSLGAPKRLGLLADGESMLNDATGVIAFKLVSAFVITQSQFQHTAVFQGFGNFLYVFIGSIIFGVITGYIMSRLIETIQNDKVIETTLTVAAALGIFATAEHFFTLSGVISVVIAGIIIGNLGKTKISPGVHEFIEEFWGYFAFLAVSLVFFFATYNLDFSIFTYNPIRILFAIVAVLIGRSVSIYLSSFITNYTPFFKNEPNIPMSWQHILNWGGLRGVIPLVLVYSLPKEYPYYNDMLSFTLGAFLFTLFVNGLTIRNLLFSFKLHIPKKEEEIIREEMAIFELDEAQDTLEQLKEREFDPDLLMTIRHELHTEETAHQKKLHEMATPEEFRMSLHLQTLELERKSLQALYKQGIISENVFFDFEIELDLQQDALEYPDVYKGRVIQSGGKIDTSKTFRKKLAGLRSLAASFPILRTFVRSSQDVIVKDRISLLQARIITSQSVLEYLQKVARHMKSDKTAHGIVTELTTEQNGYIERNKLELDKLSTNHPRLLKEYQRHLAYSFIHTKRE